MPFLLLMTIGNNHFIATTKEIKQNSRLPLLCSSFKVLNWDHTKVTITLPNPKALDYYTIFVSEEQTLSRDLGANLLPVFYLLQARVLQTSGFRMELLDKTFI